MIRVLLVDDQKMVRETLRISLEPETDIEIVGTADNGIAAIEQVEELHPDIVIMNMEMPGLDGASATKQITNRFAETKVLIHTSYDHGEYITKSLAMGAKGYLLKNVATRDLAGAIRNVNKGYTQIAPGLLEKLLISTDAGVVINRLQYSGSSAAIQNTAVANAKSTKAIAHLQQTCRQQHEEISQLKQTIDHNQEELPQIKQNLHRNRRSLWLVSCLWLLSLPLLGLFLFNLYHKTNALQAKTEDLKLSVIPTERVGLYGEFSLSGIAQRVAKVFEQDAKLGDISSIYVAQEDDTIVLLGSISDPQMLRRMENLALQVDGVRKVYSGQVAIKPDQDSSFTKNIVGSEK